ncbi:hypothetical protein ACFQJ7_01420 [Halovenus rubra]|uniref:Uncharacterized protein n=2 Tax=Halovenus rubra TaxID=869890 RepID=A0ABD5X2F2_9EURY|nr:hypothetical protein [Halovenus rubra]
MPECVRCNDFTDNKADKEYHYCDSCLDRFHEVTQSGVIVEQTGDQYTITVTNQNTELDGGREKSQVDALARAKRICDEYGVEGLFKYERTGSRWLLDEYLEAHQSVSQDVHERLRRAPDLDSDGFLDRVRSLFE